MVVTATRGEEPDLNVRVADALDKQVALAVCAGNMPPRPVGYRDTPADPILAKLLLQPHHPKWVVIPAIGAPGFVAVSRVVGGLVAVGPVFENQRDAKKWTQASPQVPAATVVAATEYGDPTRRLGRGA